MNDVPPDYDLERIVARAGAARRPRLLPAAVMERGRGMVEALQRSIAVRADGLASRLDSWSNAVTGQGTNRDKTSYGMVLPDRLLTDYELSALYHHDDMGGRMVDVVPQEMFREGFGVETGEPGLNDVVRNKLRSIDARGNLKDGQRWGRCFGGGATLIGCDDGLPMDEPLDPSRAADLDFLLTMDRRLVWPLTYYTDPGPKLGRVRQYLITTFISGTSTLAYTNAIVDETRLIVHRGMPTAEQERRQLMGWDLSVFQRAYTTLRQFNVGWAATEQLMADGSQAVFTLGGLQAIIASGGEELLHERVRTMDMFRSVVRGIVLDADANEKFERQSASLEGWPQTLQAQMLRLSAAVEVPVTILMGQSPAGMSATGESDFRWFYDRIRSMQTTDIAPMIERLAAVFLQTRAGQQAMGAAAKKLGSPIAGVTATFPDLWRETPKDRSARELSIAQRDVLYAGINTFSPDKIALVRGRQGGFDQEIMLSPDEIRDLEARLKTQLLQPEEDDAPAPDTGAPATAPAAADDGKKGQPIELAPTDLTAIIKVNEARAAYDLPKFAGGDGDLTVLQYKAKLAPTIADVASAELGADPSDPSPPPAPFGGGPPFGAAPAAGGQDDAGAAADQGGQGGQDRADAARPAGMRTFTLRRSVDETGVSGTGDVANGCMFPDGKVAMRWTTATASTTMFDSLADVEKVHGHGGLTSIEWHDEKMDGITPAASWALARLDAATPDQKQDKEAKKAAKVAKDSSRVAWAKTHEAQQAGKHAAAHPEDKHAQAAAAHADKAASAAHAAAKSSWEDAANTARPGTGQFLSAAAVVQSHEHQAKVHDASAKSHDAAAKGGGGGGGAGDQPRDDEGRFA